MAVAVEEEVDRRDALRRRIYLLLLMIGMPALAVTWWVHRSTDPFIAVAFPPKLLIQTWVGIGLYRRTMSVRTAERVVLGVVIVIYMGGFALGVLGSDGLATVQEPTTIFSLLTINMMAMLAYVAFDTRRALQVSLGVVGAFSAIVSIRLVPALLAGGFDSTALDHLRALLFLGASVGLLHVLAQTKEQAAEARSTAATMTALANTDALTGIANRRQLRAVLERRLGEVLADDLPLAVILLDVDHFKRINDAHGHDAGDEVLRGIAGVLQGAVRDDDVVGRWGGEEFLIIAPRTTLAEATVLAERCRERIAAASFPDVDRITASLGVAVHARDDTDWQLIRRADHAMYLAKREGRDQVRHDPAVHIAPSVPAERSA
ncbi:MAG TPA: GGDEF domain-containing protein [Euzebya sp.]|nr:GGDEF domain-containing protein [Euzebya sp.]